MTAEQKNIYYCKRVWVPTLLSRINGKLYRVLGNWSRVFLKPSYRWKKVNRTIINHYFEGRWHETLFNSEYCK